MSAGRLYDKIGDIAYAKIVLVTPAGIICKVCEKSLISELEDTKAYLNGIRIKGKV